MMTTLDLEFKRALHYHDEGYKSNNDYGIPPQITRHIHMYSVFTTEASFNPADFTTAQCPISPLTPRLSRSPPFQEWVCQCLNIKEISPPMPETDSEDNEEHLPTADLDDLVWDEEPVPDNREYLCIHEIPGLPQPHTHSPTPAAKPSSLSHVAPAT